MESSDLSDDPNLMADRVDIEPPIFRGCSSSELIYLVIAVMTACVPISLLAAWLVGRPATIVGVLVVGGVAGTWLGAGVFERLKRGRPDHYYVHAFRRRMRRIGLGSSPIVWRSGRWDIFRHID